MRKVFVLLAIGAQLLYLVGMAAEREHLIRTGETVFLRTTPVDPRDIFRGDYVTLRYDINSVAEDALAGDAARYRGDEHYPIFTELQPVSGSDDLYHLRQLTDVRPDAGPYLAGETTYDWQFPRPNGGIAARYGIEKLFVEQGRGIEIEERRGEREGVQIPMEVELAVDTDGTAAIRGYRWSPMGLEFEVLRQEERTFLELRALAERSSRTAAPADSPELRPIRPPELRFTLHNVSERTLVVVDPGENCSFRLVPGDWGARPWPMAEDACAGVIPTADDLHRLEPGQSHSVTLDLDQPRWHLEHEGKVRSIGELDPTGSQRFRIVYRPDPSWATDSAIDRSSREQLWLTELPGPAFSAVGQVD